MSYKIGDVIGKYTVTRDFDSANGGQCQWGFASYNGEEFFIKKFLNPVYPGKSSPGSEKSKQKRRDLCHKFETKQLAIQAALSACGDGGLVVRTVGLFKYGDDYGEHYFKVSQKVDTSSLSNEVHNLEIKKRLFVMLTAAGALKILHKNRIIHLDLKPDNILIQEWESKLIAKIIDFDSSMLEDESVAAEFLVGDPVYYSPEFARYIATGGETPPPTNKSDIFSLGLIFCQYWTGKLSAFPSCYTYANEAVLNGNKLTIPSRESSGETKSEGVKTSRLKFSTNLRSTDEFRNDENPTEAGVRQLIVRMLVLDPDQRLSINEVHQIVKHLYHHGNIPSTEIEKPSAPTVSKDTKGPRINFSNNLKH